jgi:pimeloyl-ACP methyl ester carboxylesterase
VAELVFIHGAADSGAVWQHQVDYFRERGHQVLAVDLPGHGARLAEVAFERVEQSAEDVRAQLLAAGMREPVLVGHSMGGGIALTMALTWLELPCGLVLAGSGARLRMRPEAIEAARIRAESTPPGVRVERLIRLDEVLSSAASENTRAWLRARFGQCTAQATYGDFLATHHTDLLGRLEKITQPVLVIGGEDDLWTPPRFQDYFGAHLPNVRVRMMPATGHYPFVERAQEFNEEVEQFLASLESR